MAGYGIDQDSLCVLLSPFKSDVSSPFSASQFALVFTTEFATRSSPPAVCVLNVASDIDYTVKFVEIGHRLQRSAACCRRVPIRVRRFTFLFQLTFARRVLVPYRLVFAIKFPASGPVKGRAAWPVPPPFYSCAFLLLDRLTKNRACFAIIRHSGLAPAFIFHLLFLVYAPRPCLYRHRHCHCLPSSTVRHRHRRTVTLAIAIAIALACSTPHAFYDAASNPTSFHLPYLEVLSRPTTYVIVAPHHMLSSAE